MLISTGSSGSSASSTRTCVNNTETRECCLATRYRYLPYSGFGSGDSDRPENRFSSTCMPSFLVSDQVFALISHYKRSLSVQLVYEAINTDLQHHERFA